MNLESWNVTEFMVWVVCCIIPIGCSIYLYRKVLQARKEIQRLNTLIQKTGMRLGLELAYKMKGACSTNNREGRIKSYFSKCERI
jgi:hypothetical protein